MDTWKYCACCNIVLVVIFCLLLYCACCNIVPLFVVIHDDVAVVSGCAVAVGYCKIHADIYLVISKLRNLITIFETTGKL